MRKEYTNKVVLLLFLLGAFVSLNAQTYVWEFTDAASGTTVWPETNGFDTPIQKKHSAVYTTTAVNNPQISASAAGIVVPAEINNAKTFQIMGITLRVSAGGPDYVRVSFPQSDSGRWYVNLPISTGDSEFKTYFVNMAAYGSTTGAAGTNPRADWTNTTINDIIIDFKTDDGTGSGVGVDFNSAGATVEIERIEFVNNVWKSTATNLASNVNSGNNGNWTFGKPTSDGVQELLIPTSAHQPNINVNLNAKSLHIGAGAKLSNSVARTIDLENLTISSGGAFLHNSGGNYANLDEVTVKVEVPDDKWHLISSPVNVEEYDDTWISNNGIASGTLDNRGVSTYNNGASDATTGHWRYFQAAGSATSFTLGVGYSLKRIEQGIYSFTGANFVNTATISPTVSQNTNSWNLVGNPYTAPLDIADFIADNIIGGDERLDAAYEAIYVWDADSGTNGAYVSKTTGILYPGQAFFVNSKTGATNVDFNVASLDIDYSTSAEFYKNSNTKVILNVSDNTSSRSSEILYQDGKTTRLDRGSDIGLFNGVDSDLRIYTHLIDENLGVAFEKQSLPNTNLESMVIPVGVKAAAGKEITFTAEALNLPTGLKVFLEDRVSNTFTRLDEANGEYTVSLDTALDGVGRFYIHTRSSALSLEVLELKGVSIFKTNNATLRIAGLTEGKASISLFNIQGKEVFTYTFDANNVSDISLPKLSTGIYLAKLNSDKGSLNRKIILE